MVHNADKSQPSTTYQDPTNKKCGNYLKCSRTYTCIWQQKTSADVYKISYNILTYIPRIHMCIKVTKGCAVHHEYTKYTVLFHCKIL